MSFHRFAVAFRRRVNETAMIRRLTRAWLTTGAVPVAHIVVERDDVDIPTLVLRPVSGLDRRRTVGRRKGPC